MTSRTFAMPIPGQCCMGPRWLKAFPAVVALGVLVTVSSPGCHFTPPKATNFWKWKKDEAPEVPERLLAVWTDSVLHQPGQPGVRGFGGRVYFYQTEGTDPVKVEGALAVYVFDADQLDPYQQKPLRKFVFTSEQFKDHFSNTSLGPSYSVWLPWDEVGGPARRLSMIARFEGSQGGTVISDPTIKLLPGTPQLADKTDDPQEGEPHNPVRVVGHQTHSSEAVIPPGMLPRRDIQTIDLPPSFQMHLGEQPAHNPLESPKLGGKSSNTNSVQVIEKFDAPTLDKRNSGTLDGPDNLLKTEASSPNQQNDPSGTPGVVPASSIEPSINFPKSSSTPRSGRRNIREGKPISAPRKG